MRELQELGYQEIKFRGTALDQRVQMDIYSADEGKEGQSFFTATFRLFEVVISKDPVIKALSGRTLIINGKPLNRATRYRREKAKVIGVTEVSDFAIGGRAAELGVGAIGNLANDAGRAKFSTEFVSVEAPVDHLMTIGADRDAVV